MQQFCPKPMRSQVAPLGLPRRRLGFVCWGYSWRCDCWGPLDAALRKNREVKKAYADHSHSNGFSVHIP